MLEKESNELDCEIVKELAKSSYTTEEEVYDKYIDSVRNVIKHVKLLNDKRSDVVRKLERERCNSTREDLKTKLISIEETMSEKGMNQSLIFSQDQFAHI